MFATQPLSDSPSLAILGTLLGLIVLLVALVLFGIMQPIVLWVGKLLKSLIRRGYHVWERTLGWMPWPVFAVFVVAVLAVGTWADDQYPAITTLTAALALYSGVVAVLAYIHLDFERVDIERGYKALHNPEQGQQLAHDYLKHGHRAPWPMLAAAALSFVGGFTLLNKVLWLGPGKEWYDLHGLPGTMADFAAYAVLSLYNVVDLLDTASRVKLFQLPHISGKKWEPRALLAIYKAIFALVMVQQLLSALRRSGQMGQVVRDFWNPNPAIHGRAKTTLPLFGMAAVGPLLRSLRGAAKVTREMRDELPAILAEPGPQAIPALTKHLRDPNEHVRVVAASALGRLGGRRTLARLAGMYGDPSDAVRLAVIEAIGRIAQPRADHLVRRGGGLWSTLWGWISRRSGAMRRALAALITGTKDRSPGVRSKALEALGELGPAAAAALPAVRAALHDEDEGVERHAVDTLVHVGGEGAVPDLLPLLADTSATVRLAAARGLAHLGPAGVAGAEAVARLVQDRDDEVSLAAAQALGRIGKLPPEAVAALEEGLRHKDNLVRARTARGVAEIGPIARPLAHTLAQMLEDDNDSVRAEAVAALGSIGEAVPEAMAGLTRALEDDDNWVTALAAEALGKIGGTAAGSTEGLIAALRHPTPQVRANAAAALGNLGPAGTIAAPALIEATRDRDAEVRHAAVRALGQQGRPAPLALAALRKALTDQDAPVRAAAVAGLRGLARLEEKECLPLLRDGSEVVQLEALAALPRLDNLSAGTVEEVCLCLRTDHNPDVRIKAASVLGEMGAGSETVCAALSEAALTAEVPVRAAALRSLSELECAAGPAAFAEGLKDASPDVRRAAVLGLARAGDKADAVASLLPALQDADAVIRSTAAFALGRRRSLPEEAVGPLVTAAEDDEDRVRFHAVVALRKSADDLAREAVRKRLADESARVRLAAARAILARDGSDAEARKVADEAWASSDEAVQRLARQILGERQPTTQPVAQ